MTLEKEIRKRMRATPGRYLKDTPLETGGLTDWLNNPSYQVGGMEKEIGQKPFGEKQMKMEKTHLKYCIQCIDKRTGKVGSFIYKESEKFSSIGDSWFWPDCYEMFKFMGRNGFEIKGGADFHLYTSAERGA